MLCQNEDFFMYFQKYLIIIILILYSRTISSEEFFKSTIIKTGLFDNEIEIHYCIDNEIIGFICYTKVPLLKGFWFLIEKK